MSAANRTEEGMPRFPVSFWLASSQRPAFGKLEQDLTVDVAVVGAGITGITTAYLLAREGKRVALVEAGRLLNGTTGHTTAKITAQHGLIYDELMDRFGQDLVYFYYAANRDGAEFIRSMVQGMNIDCDYTEEDAYLYTIEEDNIRAIQREYEAYKKLGIPGRLEDGIPLPVTASSAVVMPGQARFHPVKYLTRLLEEFIRWGGLVYENTVVETVEEGEPSVVVTQNGPKITCLHVVSCSHFPIFETGLYFARLHAESSYALAVRVRRDVPTGMYLSVDDPNRSVRTIDNDGEKLLLIGGESHKTGQGECTSGRYESLIRFAQEHFDVSDVLYRWSAHDLVTLDKLPYVGRATSKYPNSYVATGFRKWGMTNGTAAAMLLKDLILGADNPYAKLFDPNRSVSAGGVKSFVSQNADVAKQYVQGKLDWMLKKPEHLEPGEGAWIRYNGKKAAAYRDPAGRLTVLDATCTHMGCEVNWNDGDKSWDCPCHGSRFNANGEVMAGPAVEPLKMLQETKEAAKR
ncbi:FAD-dependent oxidoreductase [Cohnella pontilimi]|uniref:FAD-dependent oxidoreductase n=1 Tax=Cohnella pontilimi TaxID=2564100 RepID=A0A4U0F7U4_9BACL|nr:FAD-dependent oxidoreductase [Cohnella pontilimi]TJY40763.1 FAD-dependent oxidoreductase [Cohnella pontilimi]